MQPIPPASTPPGHLDGGTRLVQCLVDGGWKLFRHYDATGATLDQYELYDLSADEDLTKNLAEDPEYAPVLHKLLRQLFEATSSGVRTVSPQRVESTGENKLPRPA